MKRLVLFVEGPGDQQAVPVLIKKILNEVNPWEYLWLDDDSFRVKHVGNITGRNANKWVNWLKAAAKRRDIGGILLLLDGDSKTVFNEDTGCPEAFCAARVAQRLAIKARQAGGGTRFSVACVFACREFESWLLAGAESLRGAPLAPDGRPGVDADAPLPETDTELHPRGAKGWFHRHMPGGYQETTHQRPLTELLSLDAVRRRNPRSFRRFQHALQELCEAIRTGQHVVTPEPHP